MKANKRTDHFPHMLNLPALLILLSLLLVPLITLLLTSFQSGILSGKNEFVGLRNYIYILTHRRYLQMVFTTLVYCSGTVTLSYLLGVGGALILDQYFPGRSLARVLFLIPWAVSISVTSLIWSWILDWQFGIVNVAMQRMGLAPVGWLFMRGWSMVSVIFVTSWRDSPFICLTVLAALQNIPPQLYDAGKIDGAGGWSLFWNITVPQLRSITGVVVLMLCIWAFRRISYVLMLTGGGPSNTTQTLVLGIHDDAFSAFEFGRSSALSVLMTIFASIYVVFYMRHTKTTEVV
jgi:multiple sugar transport system permease protein